MIDRIFNKGGIMRNSSVSILTIILSVCYGSADKITNLYTDHRAMRVDDILTVVITESAKAGSQSGTSTSKKNSMGIANSSGTGVLDFIPSFGASGGTEADYDGKGSTSRQGNLVATVSARIIEVFDNGNLVIEGSKVVEINQEKEIITISGIVRPQDIEANNTVYSYNVADARISYSGKGNVNTGQRPGLLARFFNWLF